MCGCGQFGEGDWGCGGGLSEAEGCLSFVEYGAIVGVGRRGMWMVDGEGNVRGFLVLVVICMVLVYLF